MKVHVVKRGLRNKDWEMRNYPSIAKLEVVYCGYLEIDNPFEGNVWHLCNHSCWSEEMPNECKNLLISYCNSDIAFEFNGKWYSHGEHEFSSFDECYREMTNHRSEYFRAKWPHDSGFPLNIEEKDIIFVTPNNINDIINQ